MMVNCEEKLRKKKILDFFMKNSQQSVSPHFGSFFFMTSCSLAQAQHTFCYSILSMLIPKEEEKIVSTELRTTHKLQPVHEYGNHC